MKKKIFSVALVMLMLISCITAIPFSAATDDDSADTYKLVTSADELKAGGKYLIVCISKNVAMGAQNTVFRKGVAVNISSDNIISNITDDVKVVTLGGTKDAWSLYVDDGYLYWDSTTKNTISVGDSAYDWNITIANDGIATIASVSTPDRQIQWNASSPRFACYTGTQQDISLFKLEHKHSYKWNDVVGTDGSHTEVCANTDGECKELTQIVDCTWEDGYCSVCGAQAPECDHPTTTVVAEVPATCTEVGYTAGVQCTVCEQYVSGHEIIQKVDHTKVTDEGFAATCTTTGLTDGVHCSVCDEVLIEQTVIPATVHEYDVSGICTSCKFAILDITVGAFENVDTYNWYTWTAKSSTKVNVTGSGFITKNSTEIQMNGKQTGDYIYNTTAVPGKIVSVTLKLTAGKTERNFDVLTSATPFDGTTTSSLKDQATSAKQKVTEAGVTWTFDTNDKYFAIVLTDSNAAYLSSIEIAYEPIGDINSDGSINIKDLLILKKVIKGEAVANAQNTDLDGDGVTDEKDFEMLRKILLAI